MKDLAAVHSSSSTRILLEIPQPNSLNGKQSWYQTGFAYGVWQGALASHGFEVGISFKDPASLYQNFQHWVQMSKIVLAVAAQPVVNLLKVSRQGFQTEVLSCWQRQPEFWLLTLLGV